MKLKKIAKVISAMTMLASFAQVQASRFDPIALAEAPSLVRPGFGDNMFLRRDPVDRVWGWCSTPAQRSW
jgi:hypothetical protein